VIRGDITALEVDAIVNAANPSLLGGAGVCGAIFAAAGAHELQAACDAIGYCDTGDAVATPGFALPARWVIHTVGPVWRGGDAGEPQALASCYRRSLEVAASLGARTIALPAISTGVYGYPTDEAARIAVDTVRSPETADAVRAVSADRGGLDEILFVVFDDATFAAYERLLAPTS
jgi:O-acetyl-ADP-ribose deacetylase (regulator of RNase III)